MNEPSLFSKIIGGAIGTALIFAALAGSLGLAFMAVKFLFNVLRGF